MSPSRSVQAPYRELARQIHEETRANPNPPYTGTFVDIANGQVVALRHDLDGPGWWSPRCSASAGSRSHFSRAGRRASASRSRR